MEGGGHKRFPIDRRGLLAQFSPQIAYSRPPRCRTRRTGHRSYGTPVGKKKKVQKDTAAPVIILTPFFNEILGSGTRGVRSTPKHRPHASHNAFVVWVLVPLLWTGHAFPTETPQSTLPRFGPLCRRHHQHLCCRPKTQTKRAREICCLTCCECSPDRPR